jgi:hypothetical protein
MSDRPTAEGKKRYPKTGGFYDIPEGFFEAGAAGDPATHHQPCTCQPECPKECVGECGCEACSWRDVVYNDMGQTYPHVLAEGGTSKE